MFCYYKHHTRCAMEIIRADKVTYVYKTKYQQTQALKEVTCVFSTGKMTAIVGKSGSGKSTFLSLLAGLDVPTEGVLAIDGIDIKQMNRDDYRLRQASVVYQAFQLFPLLTAVENVIFPMQLLGIKEKEAIEEAKRLLRSVELPEEIDTKFPGMLSGGEQQRVAIARAMAQGGHILLADEPTGNLDTQNEANIIALLKKLAHEEGYAVIVVTHNDEVARESDVIFEMKDGILSEVNK